MVTVSPGFQAVRTFATMNLLASSEKEHLGQSFALPLKLNDLLTGG